MVSVAFDGNAEVPRRWRRVAASVQLWHPMARFGVGLAR